jgi:hypothetical protein
MWNDSDTDDERPPRKRARLHARIEYPDSDEFHERFRLTPSLYFFINYNWLKNVFPIIFRFLIDNVFISHVIPPLTLMLPHLQYGKRTMDFDIPFSFFHIFMENGNFV